MCRENRWLYYNDQARLQGRNIVLNSSYGELEGRNAREFDLTNSKSQQIWSNQVLPPLQAGVSFSLMKKIHQYELEKNERVEGKVISAKNSDADPVEGMVLLDVGDQSLVLLRTPKLTAFLPRVCAALLVATKCLR